jgi:hypothetical protein
MARFTEHQGDPAWLKSQREAQARTRNTARVHRAMPYPTQTPVVTPTAPSNAQFHEGAKSNSGAAFVLGVIAGAYLRGRRG